MNEFQAILTIIVWAAVRFGIPVLIVYAVARLIRHFQGPDPDETAEPEPRLQG